MFQTPILFLIFNRPEPTIQVFSVIKKIKPKYLFIAADGPRRNKEGEQDLCDKSRSIIKQIDWDCEVKTLFREENLGCGKAVSESITWFFEHVEHGIILEDDTLPDITFFTFCEELLEKYKNDNRVGQIAGNNFGILNPELAQYSYLFTKYVSIWGWATWKRAWNYYDFDISLYSSDLDSIKDMMKNEFTDNELKHRLNILEIMSKKGMDTWDYQWMFCNLVQNMMTIIPTTNLITNIGFGEDATHTTKKDSKISNLSIKSMKFPLKHPDFIYRSENYESQLNKEIRTSINSNSFLSSFKNKIKQIINRK